MTSSGVTSPLASTMTEIDFQTTAPPDDAEHLAPPTYDSAVRRHSQRSNQEPPKKPLPNDNDEHRDHE